MPFSRSQRDSPRAADGYRYASRALSTIRQDLALCEKPHVLDLGPARAANVAFFAEFSSKVTIEDLRSDLLDGAFAPVADAEDSSSSHSCLDAVQSLQDHSYFDLICCWDIPSYLPAPLRVELFSKLVTHLRPEGLLLLLHPDRSVQSHCPALFSIDADSISIFERSDPAKTPLRSSAIDLAAQVPECSLISSVRLRNGLFESLLSRD